MHALSMQLNHCSLKIWSPVFFLFCIDSHTCSVQFFHTSSILLRLKQVNILLNQRMRWTHFCNDENLKLVRVQYITWTAKLINQRLWLITLYVCLKFYSPLWYFFEREENGLISFTYLTCRLLVARVVRRSLHYSLVLAIQVLLDAFRIMWHA